MQTFTVIIGNRNGCSQTRRLSIAEQSLPVRLVDFSLQSIYNQSVHVTWTTATEQDNDYFVLERSKDLIQYEPVARLKAKERAAFQYYAYTDDTPYSGMSYYRLRQVDLNRSSMLYPWASVVLRKQVFGVFFNLINSLSFTLQLDEKQTARVKL